MPTQKVAVIILAAGKSTRMKSEVPKVLHPICGRPVLAYVQDLLKPLKAARSVAVLGYQHALVEKALVPGVVPALQKNLCGTADAVKQAMPALRGFKGTVLILYGDTPLLTAATVKKLLKFHREQELDATLLTAVLEKPDSYGRILRDKYNCVSGIVEEKDANDFQKGIKEINTGIMCFDAEALRKVLPLIKANNRKKEFYLTDAISLLYEKSGAVGAVKIGDFKEALGINSRVELAQANKIMQARILEEFMKEGVSIVDPASTFIAYGTKIGGDTTIHPFSVVEKDVKIGARCSVGPFAHLREGTRLEDDVVIGNFTELVRTTVGAKTWSKHFSYLGDTRVGKACNIGAGSVTANFDGKDKHVTVIKDGAFIGCDSVLVSPVVVGKGAVTGAGCVVTRNTRIPDASVAVGVPARVVKKRG